jgi:membrane-bound lytic murein transglycosylase B
MLSTTNIQTKRFSAIKRFYSFTRILVVLTLYIFSLIILSSVDAAEEGKKAADLVMDGQRIDLSQEKYQLLFKDLRDTYHFNQSELNNLFKNVAIDRKVLELMDRQWEAKPYYEYRQLFITPAVIALGKEKLHEYKALLDRIESKLGVNREIVIAIWGVESRFGTHQGHFSVFATLNTLFDAYPRRSIFFRKELIQFLVLCRENKIDPLDVRGSYAGAFGQTQFIPSSFREYAISFDGDDRVDVFTSIDDILGSIANYLRRFHWVLNAPVYKDIGHELKSQELTDANIKGRKEKVSWQTVSTAQGVPLPPPPSGTGLSIVGLEADPEIGGGYRYIAGYQNFQAITEWNHSSRYAMVVSELAEALKKVSY